MTFLFTASACVNRRGGCKLAADLHESEDISVAAGPDDEGFFVIERPDGRDFSDTDSRGQSNDEGLLSQRGPMEKPSFDPQGGFLTAEGNHLEQRRRAELDNEGDRSTR